MSAGRTVTDADRRAVLRTLDDARRRGSERPGGERWVATRDAAIIVLMWSSAIRASELCALELGQLLAHHRTRAAAATDGTTARQLELVDGGIAVVSQFRLLATQAKGGRPRRVYVPESARQRLRAWLRLRGTGDDDGPLFVGRDWQPMTRYGVHRKWVTWQRRACLAEPYRLHDLRHTAVTRFTVRCGGNAYTVAKYAGHGDIRTSMRYVHENDERIASLAEDL